MGLTCKACLLDTVDFVPGVLGSICTSCGVLAETSAQLLRDDTFGESDESWRTASAGRRGETIPSRATYSTTHKSIKSLCWSLEQSALTSRACNIHDNAIALGKIRPGTASPLVAAASVTIAIREMGLHENLDEISIRTGLKKTSLDKMVTKIQTIMQIHLPSNTASNLFSGLLRAINSWINPQEKSQAQSHVKLADKLKTYLRAQDAHQVHKLGCALETMTSSVSLFANRSLETCACALLVLAYEGEAGKAMPSQKDLLAALAHHTGVGVKTIEERYREGSKFLSDKVQQLDWTQATTQKAAPKGAKLPRDTNARYMKDVVNFQQLQPTSLVTVSTEATPVGSDDVNHEAPIEDDDFDNTWFREDDDGELLPTYNALFRARSASPLGEEADSQPPSKRRRLSTSSPSHSTDESQQSDHPQPHHQTQKLPLSQTSAYDPAVYHPSQGRPDAYVRRIKNPDKLRRERLRQAALSIVHMLPEEDRPVNTSSTSREGERASSNTSARSKILRQPRVPSFNARPTRLTLLAQTRGGSEEDDIADDELFEAGELEAFLRSEEEVETIRKLWEMQGDRMRGININIKQRSRPPKPFKRNKETEEELEGLQQFSASEDEESESEVEKFLLPHYTREGFSPYYSDDGYFLGSDE